MKIQVTVKYRDDKEEVFDCVDPPSSGDWVVIYKENMERIWIPQTAIARITCKML